VGLEVQDRAVGADPEEDVRDRLDQGVEPLFAAVRSSTSCSWDRIDQTWVTRNGGSALSSTTARTRTGRTPPSRYRCVRSISRPSGWLAPAQSPANSSSWMLSTMSQIGAPTA